MKNYKIDGIGQVVELGEGGFVIDTSNDTDFAIVNSNDDLINIRSANPTINSHLATKEYVDSLLTTTPINLFNVIVGTSDLVLADINNFTKIEVEYGFSLDSIDSIQVGKITILYDGVDAICTSHEIEESGNLAEIQGVEFDAFLDGNNFGLRFVNNSGEAFDFQYYFVNKFNIFYTPNLKTLATNIALSDTEISASNNTERFGQTITMVNGGTLDNITISMSNRNIGAPISGNITLSIYDAPNGNLLATSDPVDTTTLAINATPTGQQELVVYNFQNNLNLLALQYYIEFDLGGITNVANNINYYVTNTNAYVDGENYYDGTPYISDYDLIFEVQAI